MKKYLVIAAIAAIFVAAIAFSGVRLTSATAAGPGASANGHGTILVTNGEGKTVKRQFSFSAKQMPDGSVKGNAILHNPEFDPRYSAQFEITCLQVVGNRASFGGSIKKTSDPAFNDEFDAAFFTVYDNGEPGKGVDTISPVFFDNVVPPSSCQFIGPDDFNQIPVQAGNIQVRP